jgi:hypothetical protein
VSTFAWPSPHLMHAVGSTRPSVSEKVRRFVSVDLIANGGRGATRGKGWALFYAFPPCAPPPRSIMDTSTRSQVI